MKGEIEGAGRVKDTLRRSTASTTLSPWGLTETEQQPKSRQGLDLGPYTFVVDVQLGLRAGPLTIRVGAASGGDSLHSDY